MDISDIRRDNLRTLLNERFGGKQANLADAIDRQPGYISRCLSNGKHRKRIGEGLAREIEGLLSLEPGWLDQAGSASQPPRNDFIWTDTEIAEGDDPLHPEEVELPCFREVEFSAGDGRTQVIENHGHTMRFSLPRLARAGVQPHNAACATASGSSMEPTIADGSPVAIDKGCRHIIDGKIYALDHGGMLRVKRLYKLPLGKVRLVSDNADEYPEEVCSLMGEDAPRIIGRVFWWEVFD